MAEDPKVLTTTQARSGVTPRVVRYVLIVSILLAVAAMSWVYLAAPGATQDGPTTAEVAPR